MKRFVSKPSGEADKALSYVSKSPADMLFMLNRWRETNKLKSEFILQEFVPGIEIAVGGWLGPNGFAELFLENFEHKKLMNGELGPNTGEQGTVAKYVKNSALADYLLKPMEASLVAMGHTGYFDMAAICDDEGNLWPLESTSRCGYPTLNLQIAMHTGDPVEWMLDLVNGVDTLTATDEVCTGVVMAIPDFPYSKLTKKEVSGYPIYNLSEVEAADIHHCETMRGKAPKMEGDTLRDDAPMFVTAGDYVLVATGLGETVQESMKAVYKVLDTIEMPNSAFWRTDIGKRVVKQLPKLQAMGYCAEWPD
jgi:phosphoribosylamine--glycine ligase